MDNAPANLLQYMGSDKCKCTNEDGWFVLRMKKNARVRKAIRSYADRDAMRWLLIFPPIGLIVMWAGGCSWRRWVKSSISVCAICVMMLLVLPAIRLPGPPQSTMQYAYSEPIVDFVGPMRAPDALPLPTYAAPKFIPTIPTVVEPTPPPEPYYIFCNDGGKYYHLQKCKFVRPNTPKATIIQAIDAGYKRCKTCKSPTLKTVYGDDFS